MVRAGFSSIQFSSVAQFCPTPCDPMTAVCQASLSITNYWSLCKLMPIASVMPSNHFILCLPLLFMPSVFPSIRVFSNESVHRIRWPKYWSFSFSIIPSNEYSGLLAFKIDRLYLLAVQGTRKSLLQHNSSKTSILWHSDFFIVQLSHPYTTTGKTIALIRWTFVGKSIYHVFFSIYLLMNIWDITSFLAVVNGAVPGTFKRILHFLILFTKTLESITQIL